jgi:mRNA-degrading endonuclease RelE of RelBE toxin-antitoxin system
MYKIIPSERFEKSAKLLLKKYKSLRSELLALGEELSENPTIGSSIGKSCYKVRLGIASKGKGKSGGARVITYVVTENEEVILLTIYDKKIKEDLLPNELDELLKELE